MRTKSSMKREGRPRGRPSSWPERLALVAVALLWSLALASLVDARRAARPVDSAALASAGDGWLELRFRLVPAPELAAAEVVLEPDWAGASRHASRDAGWRRIPIGVPVIAMSASAGDVPSRPAAAGRIRAGSYDRVLVSTPVVEVTFQDGRRSGVVSHIEPIARSFEMAPGETVTIEIDLILREGASNPLNRPEIFVMDARRVAVAAPSRPGAPPTGLPWSVDPGALLAAAWTGP